MGLDAFKGLLSHQGVEEVQRRDLERLDGVVPLRLAGHLDGLPCAPVRGKLTLPVLLPEVLTGEFADWMVPPGQADALARKIAAIADRVAANPSIGRRARAHVAARFPVDRMVDGVERVLTGVVTKSRVASPAAAVAPRLH